MNLLTDEERLSVHYPEHRLSENLGINIFLNLNDHLDLMVETLSGSHLTLLCLVG